MTKEALDDVDEGIKIGGEFMKDVRFADDHKMVANSEKRIQVLINRLVETAKVYDIRVNIKKTKTMKVSKSNKGPVNITIEGQPVKQVSFKYLGAELTRHGRCYKEVKVRVALQRRLSQEGMSSLTKI